jgi:hypothetical protein
MTATHTELATATVAVMSDGEATSRRLAALGRTISPTTAGVRRSRPPRIDGCPPLGRRRVRLGNHRELSGSAAQRLSGSAAQRLSGSAAQRRIAHAVPPLGRHRVTTRAVASRSHSTRRLTSLVAQAASEPHEPLWNGGRPVRGVRYRLPAPSTACCAPCSRRHFGDGVRRFLDEWSDAKRSRCQTRISAPA